jgi:hypothetical protein
MSQKVDVFFQYEKDSCAMKKTLALLALAVGSLSKSLAPGPSAVACTKDLDIPGLLLEIDAGARYCLAQFGQRTSTMRWPTLKSAASQIPRQRQLRAGNH